MNLSLITLLAFAFTASSSLITFASDVSLSSELKSIRSLYSIPGMAAAYSKDGSIIQNEVTGVRKINDNTLISSSDKFHLGSITKSMTATLLATFIEEGKFNWNSTLEELLPKLEIHPDLKTVTLEMILAHRSGLDRGLGRFKEQIDKLMSTLNTSKITIAEERGLIISVLLRNSPAIVPGSAFSYSNSGYLLLGHILEKYSGKSWETLIQERLFAPLGMKSCGFGSPVILNSKSPDQPWGHSYDDKGNIQSSPIDNNPLWGPAGTVHCTINDLSKYLTMHINGFNGIDSVVKSRTFEKLHTAYPGQAYTYGGWFRYQKNWANGTVLTHSGTNEKNMAYVWLAPKKQTSYFGFANLGGEQKDVTGAKGSDKAASAIDEIIGVMIKLSLTEN